MKECCANCRNRLHGIKTDFGKLNTGEAIDTPMEGFICLALAYEGVAHWMVNHDEEKGMCEMHSPKVQSADGNSDAENAKCTWHTPPKVPKDKVITTCVSVPAALIVDEQTDCPWK